MDELEFEIYLQRTIQRRVDVLRKIVSKAQYELNNCLDRLEEQRDKVERIKRDHLDMEREAER